MLGYQDCLWSVVLTDIVVVVLVDVCYLLSTLFRCLFTVNLKVLSVTLSCVIPVVCVTNEREENVVKQHN